MIDAKRDFSEYANSNAIHLLNDLLESTSSPEKYRNTMLKLGTELGASIKAKLINSSCLVISTAEDADFLSRGIIESISSSSNKVYAGVFWNNHYQISNGISVAPIVHKYLQQGFESSENLIVAKSVISGSCVVRSNILELIERLDAKRIFIVSPVMHKNAEEKLRSEFPENISARFEFVYFAKDSQRDENSGEVTPGIGGMVYKLLGLSDQPVRVGYVPQLVKEFAQRSSNHAV